MTDSSERANQLFGPWIPGPGDSYNLFPLLSFSIKLCALKKDRIRPLTRANLSRPSTPLLGITSKTRSLCQVDSIQRRKERIICPCQLCEDHRKSKMRTVKLSKPEGELFASPKSDKNFAMRLKILKALDRETAKIEIE